MISFIGNRPALQVGSHQLLDYDTAWLDHALQRAAEAAQCPGFPFLEEVRKGVEKYLECKCPLRLLHLEDLFDRMRRMLVRIGCAHIAEKLELLAPPVTVSLERAAAAAGNGFELAFFGALREELSGLREAGAEEIRFTGLRESALMLRGGRKWNRDCERLCREIEAFIGSWSRGA
jgi:hypothetical protein